MPSNRSSSLPVVGIFSRFPDLPIEIQSLIWGLAIAESSLLWAHWPDHEMCLLAPICPIPKLGTNDPVGLIPYKLPIGVPSTLNSHPPPSGLAAGTVDSGYDTSLRIMSMTHRSHFTRTGDSWTSSLRKMMIQPDKPSSNAISGHAALTLLSVCHLSRQVVLTRRATIRTKQQAPEQQTASLGDVPLFYPSFKGGSLSGNVFKDQYRGRSCFLFILGSDPSKPLLEKSPLRKVKTAYRYSHVAARLGDIEKCVLGSRLSFTQIPDGLNRDRFKDAEDTMWWRPDLGSRVRRPEAGHPFNITPGTILALYSAVLHQLASLQVTKCMEGHARNDWSVRPHGQWYFSLLEEGKCIYCSNDLLLPFCESYPELIDAEGHIDVMVLLDRHRFEQPEHTQSVRPYEIGE
ncbi:unnamed protein product [Clonostachys rhizophaga]|uniref:2EXR domain-containing protein n=1 Tax=Clonostachys rhizophaga TaxID=160324 RepID=A0A9N9VSX8_9HYPO|nr:unnamed protein product [Clonostachys rhizophaga]